MRVTQQSLRVKAKAGSVGSVQLYDYTSLYLHQGTGYTLEVRLQPENITGKRILLYVRDTGGNTLEIGLDAGKPYVAHNSSAVACASVLPVDSRSHVVWHRDGSDVEIWVNGALAASGTLAPVANAPAAEWNMLAGASLANNYLGYLDYMRRWPVDTDPSTLYALDPYILNDKHPLWSELVSQWCMNGRVYYNGFEPRTISIEGEPDVDCQGYVTLADPYFDATKAPDWLAFFIQPTTFPDTRRDYHAYETNGWLCGHLDCFELTDAPDLWMWGRIPPNGVPVRRTFYPEALDGITLDNTAEFERWAVDSSITGLCTISLNDAYWPSQYRITEIKVQVYDVAGETRYDANPAAALYYTDINVVVNGDVAATTSLWESKNVSWYTGVDNYCPYDPRETGVSGHWTSTPSTDPQIITIACSDRSLDIDVPDTWPYDSGVWGWSIVSITVSEPPITVGGEAEVLMYKKNDGSNPTINWYMRLKDDPTQPLDGISDWKPTLVFWSRATQTAGEAQSTNSVVVDDGHCSLKLTQAEWNCDAVSVKTEREDAFGAAPTIVLYGHTPDDLGSDNDTISGKVDDANTAIGEVATAVSGVDAALGVVDGNVDDIEAILDNWVANGLPGIVPVGENLQVVLVTDGTNPVPDARVWLASDASGATVVGASQYASDANGRVELYTTLADGATGYVFAVATGYSFPNPVAITIGDDYTLTATAVTGEGVTLETLIAKLRVRLDDVNKEHWELDTELTGFINEGYLEALTAGRFADSEEVSGSVSGTAVYALSRIFNPTTVTYGGEPLDFTTTEKLDSAEPGWRSAASDTPRKWLRGSGKSIRLYPAPDESATEIRVGGLTVAQELVELSDTPALLPAGFEYMLLDWAEYRARASRPTGQANAAIAQIALAKFSASLDSLKLSVKGND
jgi:hypothetical protein